MKEYIPYRDIPEDKKFAHRMKEKWIAGGRPMFIWMNGKEGYYVKSKHGPISTEEVIHGKDARAAKRAKRLSNG